MTLFNSVLLSGLRPFVEGQSAIFGHVKMDTFDDLRDTLLQTCYLELEKALTFFTSLIVIAQ